MAAGGGEPAGQASSNERAEPRGGCGAAEPRMAPRCPASSLQGLGPDPQPRGTSPPPSGLRGFSNYPAAVPGPPAALRAALLSPEKCQGLNSPGGGEGVSWGTSSRCLGNSGRPPVPFFPEDTVTGGEGRWRGRTQLLVYADETHVGFEINDTRSESAALGGPGGQPVGRAGQYQRVWWGTSCWGGVESGGGGGFWC